MIGCAAPKEARDIADRLLARFGSAGAVLSASSKARASVIDAGSEVSRVFDLFGRTMLHVLHDAVVSGPILSNYQSLVAYLKLSMADALVERLRVLFLNAQNELVADEILSSGTIGQVTAYPREILRRALEIGATALVLVHNHPSGCPVASGDDVRLTVILSKAAALFDIVIHDHLIVARRGVTSLRREGVLTSEAAK